MERLTKRVGVDEAVPICNFDICAPFIKSGYCKTGMRGGFPRRWERHCNDACILGRMIDRLAAYEDTGLTPEQVAAQKWIPVTERLPEEHDSIWAKLYGTKSWQPGLFRKCSYEVLACVEKKDGRRRVVSIRTYDGKWDHQKLNEETVVCWQPMPQPPKEVNQ